MQQDEWLAQRRTCITGTDISAIVGLNPYATAMSVYMDKLGLSEPIKDNEPMRWGRLLEPVIAQRYSEDNGVEIRQGEFIKKEGIFGGTPDYLTDQKLIEIKTVGIYGAKNFGESGSDIVPDHYLCQVQWYLNLVGMERADLVALIAGQDYRVFHIERNEKLITILCDATYHFWHSHIVTQEAPAIDASESSEKYLKAMYPKSRGNIVTAPAICSDIAEKLAEVKQQIEELEDEKNLLENNLKDSIGENDGIEDFRFKATWKSAKDSVKTNWEKVAKELNPSSDLIEKYTTVSPGRDRKSVV